MKTTLNLNDSVFRQAKSRAQRNGVTLTRFVEDALRAQLMGSKPGKRKFKLQMCTVRGTRPPNVDIFDREALYEVLDAK